MTPDTLMALALASFGVSLTGIGALLWLHRGATGRMWADDVPVAAPRSHVRLLRVWEDE